MIELRGVSKVYGRGEQAVTALRNVSLRVEYGEIFGVLGQSGAGKSTLIRCVNLLERPTGGEVRVDGKDMLSLSPAALREARQGIGMIFQHFNLFNSRTVAGNVAWPLEVAGWPRERIQERVEELLALVGLADKARAYPAQLSGGQKQRVGIARALAPRPRILLSDEATSALDPETTRSVLGLLRDINQKLGLTILLITHQMEVVKSICDSVAVLEQGRVVEQGKAVDLIARPGTRLHELCYPTPAPVAGIAVPGGRRVELSLVGENSTQPILTTLARRFGVDAWLLEGSMERVGETRVGRLLFELTGPPEAVDGALGFLREQGLTPEVPRV
ncbi:ATP-binding cassette domain-containing protein [Pyxidicoccus fallax]|uniref:Cell division ATP-binding protein FtsE n=1 Tax=Pyxidicoccus fallax TaxID=394095 RepID=A0A848LGH7_9BACT|nr:ATP-binding cassette domain-containing protein [Pyxidicoccus fallax]NPC80288.1 ATP-binding cassette domain-containing protein [Pyxidicoccus fallax]